MRASRPEPHLERDPRLLHDRGGAVDVVELALLDRGQHALHDIPVVVEEPDPLDRAVGFAQVVEPYQELAGPGAKGPTNYAENLLEN